MTLFLYLFFMAGVTYLVRAIPFAFFTKKITNRYIKSFLYYVPYAVLSAMTFPAIFFSTGNLMTACFGTALALVLAFFNCSLTTVAMAAAVLVFVTSFIF